MTFSHERVGSSKVRRSSSDAVLLKGRYTPTLLNPAAISGGAMGCSVMVFSLVALLVLFRGFVDEPVRLDIASGVLLALWALPVFQVGREEYRRSGRYELGEEELVWMPHEGPPVRVRLRDIDRLDFKPSTQEVCIALKDGLELQLVSVSQPERLALFLHIKTWMLRERIVAAERRVDAACRDGYLTNGSLGSSRGAVIIRPGRLVFLPFPGHEVTRDSVLLGSIWGSFEHWTSLPYVPSTELLEHLRWLPEREFNQCIQRAMNHLKGVVWTRDEVCSCKIEKDLDGVDSLTLIQDKRRRISISYYSSTPGSPEADKQLLMRSVSAVENSGT
jgi:hypothetical protein